MAALQGLCFCNQSKNSVKFRELRGKKFAFRSSIIRCERGGASSPNLNGDYKEKKKTLRILIAGGGVGGLVLALAAKNRGFEVKVFEKNLSAVRGEGRHRGPIQLLSNALTVLEAIDKDVAKQIMEAGVVTGDRINGLADGISGEWFTLLDLLTPAVKRRLPITQMICRMTLQDILVNAVGLDIVSNRSNVVDFQEDSDKVTVILEDGRLYEGDILVGADGIWSNVRSKLFGWQEATYSNYTCYSGFVDYVPPYIDTIAHRVFLGFNQYFVASDVGAGKMQWYGFTKEPPGNTDPPGSKKKRLLELFGTWCGEVVTLISETPEDMILQRDVYDRDMINCWGRGRVTLLGDAAHAMQPNLGQGGCMAIEDGYQLILELEKIIESSSSVGISGEIASALKRYERKRMNRVTIIHTVTRMTSRMVTTYQPYLNFGSGPLSFLTKMRITNPALLGPRLFFRLGMSQFMTWMLVDHGCGKI